MHLVLMLVGVVCLVVGINLITLPISEGFNWAGMVGGFLVGASYGIAWRKF